LLASSFLNLTEHNLQNIEQGKQNLLDFYNSAEYTRRLQNSGMNLDFMQAHNYQNNLINAVNKTEPRFVKSRNAGSIESDAMAYTKGQDSQGTKLGIDFSKKGLERPDAQYLASHEYGHTSLYDIKNKKLLENLPKLELDSQTLKLWESEAEKEGGQSYKDLINYYSNPDEARQRGINAILYSKNKGISTDEFVDMSYDTIVNLNRTGEIPTDLMELRQLYSQKDLKKYLKELYSITGAALLLNNGQENEINQYEDGGIIDTIKEFFTEKTNKPAPKSAPAKSSPKTFKIEDKRKVLATSGQPIRPNVDITSGEYDLDVLKGIIESAKRKKLPIEDVKNLAAIAFQETKFGKTDKNIGHVIDGPFYRSDYEALTNAYINKMKKADKLGIKDDATRLQVYNGLGVIKPSTEQDYHGFKMKKIYGVPVPSTGISMKKNPLYGKQIMDLKDNVLNQNPEYVNYLNTLYNSKDPVPIYSDVELKSWGRPPLLGKFADGGKVQPYITNNPNDPRIQKYQDSLLLYNLSEKQRLKGKYNKENIVFNTKNDDVLDERERKWYQDTRKKLKGKFFPNSEVSIMIKGKDDRSNQNSTENDYNNDEYFHPDIKPLKGYNWSNENGIKRLLESNDNFLYKKPVQPVILNQNKSTVNTTKGKVRGKVVPNDVKGSKLIQIRKEIKPENTNFNVNANGEFSTPEDYVGTNFEQRIQNPVNKINNEDGTHSTHKMMSFEADGKFYAAPTIIEKDGKLIELNPNDAIEYALKNNEFREFGSEKEAQKYAEGDYKKGTPLENRQDFRKYLQPKGFSRQGRGAERQSESFYDANGKMTGQIINGQYAPTEYGKFLESGMSEDEYLNQVQEFAYGGKINNDMKKKLKKYPAGGYLDYQEGYKGFGVGPQLYQDNSYFRSIMPDNIENIEEQINEPSVFSGINNILGAVNQGVNQATGLLSQFSQPKMGGNNVMSKLENPEDLFLENYKSDLSKKSDLNEELDMTGIEDFDMPNSFSGFFNSSKSSPTKSTMGPSIDSSMWKGVPFMKNGGYLKKYQDGGSMDMLPVGSPEYIHKSNVFHENYNPVPRVHFTDDTTPYDMGVNLNDLVNMNGGRINKYQNGGDMSLQGYFNYLTNQNQNRLPLRAFNANTNRASLGALEAANANDFLNTKVRKDRQSFEDDKVDWGFMDWAKEPVGALTGVLSTVPIVGDITQSALGDSFLTRTGGYAVGKGVGNVGMGAAKVIGGAATGNIGMIGSGIGDVGEGVGSTVGTFQAKDALSNYDKSGYVSGNRMVNASQDFGNMMDSASGLFGNIKGGVGMVKNMGGLKGMLGNMKGGAKGMKGLGNIMGKITGIGGQGGGFDFSQLAGMMENGGYLNNYQEGGMVSMPEDFEIAKFKKGGLTPKKAREILHDKSVHGNPLTDKQRKYFGYISSQKKSSGGWLDEL
jgi:hypothetical protein